jgi:hypothetical protein
MIVDFTRPNIRLETDLRPRSQAAKNLKSTTTTPLADFYLVVLVFVCAIILAYVRLAGGAHTQRYVLVYVRMGAWQ